MSNMGYCRFQNTAGDFAECLEHALDDLSGEEFFAREELIDMCIQFLENFGADAQEISDMIQAPAEATE